MVATAGHDASESTVDWDDLDEKKQGKKESKAKKRLNRGAVSNMTVARLHSSDPDGEVLTWLGEISRHLR